MKPTTERIAERKHIESVPGRCGGKPCIVGHRIRVQDIVVMTENGQTADQIVDAFPELTLADVHAALAYYFDHQADIDRDIAQSSEFAAKIRGTFGPGPLGEDE